MFLFNAIAKLFSMYCEMLSRLHASGADLHSLAVGKRGPLEIGIFSCFTRWVEFSSTNTIAILSRNHRSFIAH